MDLLSLIGLVTKRRGGYFSQAESLAKRAKTLNRLESIMEKEAKVLVKALRDKEIRWEEYSRTLIDKTLISALTGVYLGAENSKPKEKLQKAWPTIVGEMLPPLTAFLDETGTRLNDGTLMLGNKTYDFADTGLEDILDNPDYDIEDPQVQAAIEAASSGGVGKTWRGVFSRVIRYIASPAHSFFSLGEYFVREEQGFKEMRRVAKKDRRTCQDCKDFERLGWQSIGTLPMPGHQCRCYDRCRCFIEYR